MKKQAPLVTLRNLAQKAVEQITHQLGQLRQSHQNTEQQLNALLEYQAEYQAQLNTTLIKGMAATHWQNYHKFIQTLEHAITQHRQQLAHWSLRIEHAVKQWQEKQQRLNAYDTLLARAETTQRRQESRLDQKLMDEFAQRTVYGSAN